MIINNIVLEKKHLYMQLLLNAEAIKKQVKSAEEVIATKIEVKRTQPLKDKEFLSPKECAEILNIALSSIYKMIYQGKIPAFQFSSRFTRIRKSDIDSMMSSTSYVKRNRISHTPITDF